MDHPWRKVCERHARQLASRLNVSGLGSEDAKSDNLRNTFARVFFKRHLGPMASYNNKLVTSLRPFVDAIAVVVQFAVIGQDTRKLAHFRQCALDIKTSQLVYH
jgi:hypothetical protein